MSVLRGHRLAMCVMLAVGLLVASPSLAATVYVDQTNVSGTEDGTEAFPYVTIQAGIGNAAIGDKVTVAPGTYKEAVVMADGVSVIGAGWRSTIIDGSLETGSAVTFDRTRLGPVLSGFTISGGSGDQRSDVGGEPVTIGGGILILNSSPVIRDNVIIDNVLDEGYCLGGGIYIDAQDTDHPMIEKNVIRNNIALSTTLADEGRGGLQRARGHPHGRDRDSPLREYPSSPGSWIAIHRASRSPARIRRATHRHSPRRILGYRPRQTSSGP